MKATGIVRRIDDLGRVVVPKEIRRTLRIREGDPLEIFTDREGEIILKKYSPIGELGTFAKQYAAALAQSTGNLACITDKDQIIAVAGGKKELLSKPINRDLENIIDKRTTFIATSGNKNFCIITDGLEEYNAEAISPVITEGDVVGAIILLSKDSKNDFGTTEGKLTATAALFLGKQMEA